jgi:hypothetical protein
MDRISLSSGLGWPMATEEAVNVCPLRKVLCVSITRSYIISSGTAVTHYTY